MNLSYFRIKLPVEKAKERLYKWNESQPNEIIECKYSEVVKNSLNKDGQWKGSCLYVYESQGWTVFEDVSGFYSGGAIPVEPWKEFAENDSFVMAGINDAIPYGELIVIEKGKVQKEIFNDRTDNSFDVNNGEAYPEIKNWMDIDDFIQSDEIVFSEKGTLLIYI